MRLHLQNGLGGEVGDDIATGDGRQQFLHERKLDAFGEVLLHGHQLLQDEEAQTPLSRSHFHNIYRFRFVARRSLEPVVHELDNHVRVALCE